MAADNPEQAEDRRPGLAERYARGKIEGGARKLLSGAASKLTGRIASLASGAASGGLLTAVQAAGDAVKFVRKHGGKILSGALSSILAINAGPIVSFLVGLFTIPFLIALIGIPIITTLILFIINSGAYIVPVGSVNVNPGIAVSGTCPLTGYVQITETSYNPQDETGHGSNSYWDLVTTGEGTDNIHSGACTIFEIPTPWMWSDCWGPSDPAASDNYCSNATNGTCPYYGYALDVVSDNNNVYLPTLCDGGECPPLQWRVAYLSTSPNGGSVLILDADGNGHSYRLALIHIDTDYGPGDVLTSGTQVATLANLGANTHLHIELNVDGTPVRPDFMCGGGYYGPGVDLPGWYITIPTTQASSLVSTRLPTVSSGTQTCTWAQGQGVGWAVNANLYSDRTTPDGPAGYDGDFTNRFSSHTRSLFYSFVVTNSGVPRIIGGYRYNSLPEDLQGDLNARYRLAVTGASWDSFPNEPRPRTVIGLSNSNIYILVLPSALPGEADAAIRELGATQSFLLDGGGSTTLCQGGSQIFPAGSARSVSNHLGGNTGNIEIVGPEN